MSTFFLFALIYIVWRSTGGVERGEERRANDANSLFVEVTNVHDSYGNQEFFSAFEAGEVEELLEAPLDPE